ncbi:hypothetical protein EDB89DRAFT_2075790 [Lactarius sanguifluus]|nr:hypothetical protein EDB89DRAFT_2075790 [Lactarius sanguifluus]
MAFPFLSQKASQTSSPAAHTPLRPYISGLLALYALYTVNNLLFARPPNLFTSLRLPLNAPQATIHAALQQNMSPSDALPPTLEKLLARLASLDARTMLVRYVSPPTPLQRHMHGHHHASFGQRAIQTCTHCTTQADYALHALPPALLSYTLAAAVLGATTARGTGCESRRGVALIVLVVGALAEAYWAYTVPISIPSARRSAQTPDHDEIIMWHDALWSLRHALFIALPLILHFLPATPAPPPLRHTLQHAAHTADVLLARAHLLRLGTASTQRVPELRARAAAFWEHERGVGEAVRQDVGVRAAAERARLGLATSAGDDGGTAPKQAGEDGAQGEGALHQAARGAVEALKEVGLRPPAA